MNIKQQADQIEESSSKQEINILFEKIKKSNQKLNRYDSSYDSFMYY